MVTKLSYALDPNRRRVKEDAMSYESETSRFQRFDWRRLGSSADPADCERVNRFLCRAAHFYERRQKTAKHPFHDLADVMDLPQDVVQSATIDFEASPDLQKFPLAQRIVRLHLLATRLLELGIDGAMDAVEMYRPLLEVFEHGGVVDMHHGEILVDNTWSASLHNWIERCAADDSGRNA